MMNPDVSQLQPIGPMSSDMHEQHVREAKQRFQRVLASWASDLLILRSRGMRDVVWNSAAHREAA